MKRLLFLFGLLLFSVNVFAFETDIDFGLTAGGGFCNMKQKQLSVEIEKDYKTGLFGLYANVDAMFTKNFGLFYEVNLDAPFNTSFTAEAKFLAYSLDSSDDGYKSTLFLSQILGAQGCIPIGEKLNIKFGGGFDFAVLHGENKSGFGYNIINGAITYTDVEETLYLFGLGSKLKAQFFFTKNIGLNAGCAVDWYFVGADKFKQKTLLYGTFESTEKITENFFFFRPEVGMTFRLGSN